LQEIRHIFQGGKISQSQNKMQSRTFADKRNEITGLLSFFFFSSGSAGN
jgi:hypothetical protein